MSKTNADTKVTEPEEKPQEGAEEQPTGTSTETGTEGEQPTGDEEEDEDDDSENEDLPEWAKSKLSKANKEAGRYRTQLRELQSRLEGAKTPEEVAAITSELTESNTTLARELAVEKALRKHGLTDEDAVFLTGSTPEEIAAQAERAAARFGSSAPKRLRGGLDPTEDDESSDPGELAKKYGRRRY